MNNASTIDTPDTTCATSLRQKRQTPAALKRFAGQSFGTPEQWAEDSLATTVEALRQTGLFDDKWYTDRYPDVAEAGADALEHYVRHGAAEGRDPAPWFDTAFYLQTYPDIVVTDVNPLYHFIFHGYAEKRAPCLRNVEAAALAAQATKLEGLKKFAAALDKYSEALAEIDDPEDVAHACHRGLGRCAMQLKRWGEAEEAFRNAILLQPESAGDYHRLSESLCRQYKWWQEVDALEHAVELDSKWAAWWYRLGQVREIMERWGQAATAYGQAIQRDGQWAEWHYRLGYVQEQQGLHVQAQKSYALAIARDKKLGSDKFGIGVFHQQRAYWPEARKAYEQNLRTNPGHAGLYSKLAVAHHRCHDMEKAALANISALTCARSATLSNKERADCFYRLGITSERMGKLDQAAEAYACSRDIQKDAYRCYRHGYTLAQAGRFEEACAVYMQWRAPKAAALPLTAASSGDASESTQGADLDNAAGDATVDAVPSEEACAQPLLSREESLTLSMARQAVQQYQALLSEDYTRPEWHFALGHYLEMCGDQQGASSAFAAAAARQSKHFAEGWYRLGKVLAALDRWQEACDAFAHLEILRRPYWVDKTHYNKNIYFKRSADYLEYCEHLPVAENVVLYESLLGNAPGDSPLALCNHMRNNGYEKWMHVWSVTDMQSIPNHMKKHANVIFVTRESNAYLRHLATAKICINDCTFPQYFTRRDDQRYINTWHGTPIKTLGKHITTEPVGYDNAQRNFLQATHLIYPNDYTKNIISESNNINGLFNNISMVTGYPRNDITVTSTKKDRQRLCTALGIDNHKKIILYAPTWRGAFAGNSIKLDIDFIQDVMSTCQEFDEYTVLFRAHHALERRWKEKPQCIIVPNAMSSNELLGIADVLITDYSSIVFDFIATGRPIIIYAHDLDQYEQERGFYFSPRELPAAFCQNVEELHAAIKNLPKHKITPQYKDAQKKFCPLDDGKACERVVALFDAPLPKAKKSKNKKLLFYIDILPNGIGMSFLALMEYLDKSEFDIYIMVNKSFMVSNPETLKMFNKLPPECKVIATERIAVKTLEEDQIYRTFETRRELYSDYARSSIECMYRREYRRLFGTVTFDACIDFTGYSATTTELFAFAQCKKKIVYLHNDMLAEANTRFPVLKRIFMLYNNYDCLASVSSSVNCINKNNLTSLYRVLSKKFIAIPNLQRPEFVRSSAQEALPQEDEQYFDSRLTTFITIGRLSPEKNQAMLLDAFANLHAKNANTRLLILGKGPLENKLKAQITDLGLENSAFILGHKDNPYPYLDRADCFVFSSLYEGQGLALFEALALNKPIVATNIPTSCEVLENGKYGILVEKSVNSLATGMANFASSNIAKFDFDVYTNRTLESLSKIF